MIMGIRRFIERMGPLCEDAYLDGNDDVKEVDLKRMA